ncbi:hypothetical protein [Luteolibacter sp. Populi]|uniref:hypothetical protein n=1 Tax=Luteolibacter sp. Populi TaxID=3230487 RepID=UPI0034666E47
MISLSRHAARMIARWIVFTLLLLAGAVQASVTAGWRMPIEAVVQGAKADEVLPRLEKPPGKSAFFEEGDVLRDLSKLVSARAGNIQLSGGKGHGDDANPFEEAKDEVPVKPGDPAAGPWTGDWVVWNERSGMVVARGSYNDVFVVEESLGFPGLPRTILTKFELVCGDPARSWSLIVSADSGGRIESEAEGVEVDTDAVSSETGEWVDQRFMVSWAVADETFRDVTTAFLFKSGERTLIARQGSGASRWELFVTPTVELAGGLPVNEARRIERDGRVEFWPRKAGDHGRIVGRLDDGQESCLFPVPFRRAVWMSEGGSSSGPFSRVTCPDAVGNWMRGEVADLREKLLPGNPGKLSFAGYDSRSGRAMLVGDGEGFEWAEALLDPGLYCPAPPGLQIESNGEAGSWLLACRTGEKACISLRRGDEIQESFAVEPSIKDEAVELRFTMDIMPESAVTGRIESMTVLMSGVPRVVGAGVPTGGGEEVKFTLMVRTSPP